MKVVLKSEKVDLDDASLKEDMLGRVAVIPTKEIGGCETSAFLLTNSNIQRKTRNMALGASSDSLQQTDGVSENLPKSVQSVYDRKEKVAKMGYADHGAHGVILSVDEAVKRGSPLVKKLTCSLKNFCEENEKNSLNDGQIAGDLRNATNSPEMCKGMKKRGSPSSVEKSNAIQANVTQSITGEKKVDNSNNSHLSRQWKQTAPPSLLHAALQENADNSAKRNDRGECLTNPGIPNSNNGLDNAEGNLIVHRNDLISIPPCNVHMHKNKVSPTKFTNQDIKMTDFEVLGVLGQGTFAQVFKCRNIATGQLVALKIVKNKSAYTRQAAIEIDIFHALEKDIPRQDSLDNQIYDNEGRQSEEKKKLMVELICYFMHESHLCLVFELLGMNLYEVLKRRQFRGLPMHIVRNLVKQAIEGVKELSQRNIVHCDLKPENILVASDSGVQDMVCAGDSTNRVSRLMYERKMQTKSNLNTGKEIKLIDFGSACFEGQTAHTYIQSRFYRSPEVLVGLDYDSAIDMWSLGCVAAELFLGLPILPGVHEHDQISRIAEMIGKLPDWMLDQGSKSRKYFVSGPLKSDSTRGSPDVIPIVHTSERPAVPKNLWRLRTREEFLSSLPEKEKDQCCGLSKYEQQPTNRYFKTKLLEDIVMLHGSCSSDEEKEVLGLFVHFLKGVLNPDPCERWTAFQASMHPFITGNTSWIRRRRGDVKTNNTRNISLNSTNSKSQVIWDIQWKPPFDHAVCRRKLSLREIRRDIPAYPASSEREAPEVPDDSNFVRLSHHHSTSRVTDLTGAMSISHSYQHANAHSPPPNIGVISGPTRPLQSAECHPYYQDHISTNFGSIAPGLEFHHALPGPSHSQHASSLSHLHNQFDNSEMVPILPTLPVTLGAQSFSGVYYDRINHIPAEGELGYALQRPGVVPHNAQVTQINRNSRDFTPVPPPFNAKIIQINPNSRDFQPVPPPFNAQIAQINPNILSRHTPVVTPSQPSLNLGHTGRPNSFTSRDLKPTAPPFNAKITQVPFNAKLWPQHAPVVTPSQPSLNLGLLERSNSFTSRDLKPTAPPFNAKITQIPFNANLLPQHTTVLNGNPNIIPMRGIHGRMNPGHNGHMGTSQEQGQHLVQLPSARVESIPNNMHGYSSDFHHKRVYYAGSSM